MTGTNRWDFPECSGVVPDVDKLLPSHIAARQGKLHAGVDFAVRRDIAERMTGTARKLLQHVVGSRGRGCADLLNFAHQIGIMEDLLQVLSANSERQDGTVPIQLGG